jgi:hypothetical protein
MTSGHTECKQKSPMNSHAKVTPMLSCLGNKAEEDCERKSIHQKRESSATTSAACVFVRIALLSLKKFGH